MVRVFRTHPFCCFMVDTPFIRFLLSRETDARIGMGASPIEAGTGTALTRSLPHRTLTGRTFSESADVTSSPRQRAAGFERGAPTPVARRARASSQIDHQNGA